jgi:hypothetical protein
MITASNLYKFSPPNFPRCAGSGRSECDTCKLNVNNSPIHPSTTRQIWIGRWELETPCESRVPLHEQP